MAATVVTTLFFVAYALDTSVNTNMVVYWGQGPSQQRLSHYCQDSAIDVIPLAFLNVFPDQVHGGYPGTNFGNQCGPETYKNPDHSASPLLSNCANIGPDIKKCQAAGKKILLSLGGGVPTDQSINDDASAVKFANFLWDAFGPKRDTYGGPRPFGDAVVDGFDFDIENVLKKGENAADLSRGYGTMITTLRALYEPEKPKKYYISGAPQCVVPDVHLAPAIMSSSFDFVFVQFYNTPQCSARAFFNHTYGAYGGPPTDISFDAWVSFLHSSSFNPHAKIYLGLPAAPTATYDSAMYLNPSEAKLIIEHFQARYPDTFGGVMLFDATRSETNSIGGKSYADVLKKLLLNSHYARKPRAQSTAGVLSSTTSYGHSSTSLPPSSSASLYPSSSSDRNLSTSAYEGQTSSSYPTVRPYSSGTRPIPYSRATSPYPYSGYGPIPYSSQTAPYPYSSGTGARPYYTATGPAPSTGTAPYPYFSSTGARPYYTATGPAPYSTGTAPYPYSSSTGPRPYSGTGPHLYSSATELTHSTGSGPVPHSYETAPYPYSSGTGPSPYSSKAAPYAYSSTTGPFPYAYSGPVPYASTGPVPYASSGPVPYTSTGPVPYASSGPVSYASSGPVPHASSGPVPYASSGPVSYASSGPVPYASSGPVSYASSGPVLYASSGPVSYAFSGPVPYASSGPVPYANGTLTRVYESASSSTPQVHVSATSLTLHPSINSMAASSQSPTTQEVVTTVLTTSYVTTCPVTKTITLSGSLAVRTTLSVSTVYVTYTSTICTKCIAPSTPMPLKPTTTSSPAATTDVITTVIVHTSYTTCPVIKSVTYGTKETIQVSQTVSTIYETFISTICTKCTASPIPTSVKPSATPLPATTTDVVTTIFVRTSYTTCPVTKTVVYETKAALQVSQTISTIYETVTSTFCTKCVAPPTPAPTVSSYAATTQEAVTTVIVSTFVTTCPVTKTIAIGTGSSLQVTQSVSTIYETITSTICTKCVAPPTSTPVPVVYAVGSSFAAASPYSPVETGIPSPAPFSPLAIQSSTPAAVSYGPDTTLVATFNSYTSTTVVGIVTKTLLPVPEFTLSAASQPIIPVFNSVPVSNVPHVPVYSSVPVGNVPYPVSGNSTAPGLTGTSLSTGGTISATPEAYTGAANKMGMGLMSSLILAAIMAALFA